MVGFVNGQKVDLIKDKNTGRWVKNPVAVVNPTTTAVANPINPLDVSEDYKKGFVDAFNRLSAVLDGVAESGKLRQALDAFDAIQASGIGSDTNITFQELMELIQQNERLKSRSNPLITDGRRMRREVPEIGYQG